MDLTLFLKSSSNGGLSNTHLIAWNMHAVHIQCREQGRRIRCDGVGTAAIGSPYLARSGKGRSAGLASDGSDRTQRMCWTRCTPTSLRHCGACHQTRDCGRPFRCGPRAAPIFCAAHGRGGTGTNNKFSSGTTSY
jgi:hypothetical protein